MIGSTRKSKKNLHMETNENEGTSVQNLWDTAKAVLRGIYIAIQVSLKKIEKSRIHPLSLYLKELENQQQIKPAPHRISLKSKL